MKALSAASSVADPYSVGLELGQSLAPIKPEVVFLFGTKYYVDSPYVIEGLYDGLGDHTLSVVGNSGDGFYESSGAGDTGTSALGLNSEGAVQWHVFYQKDVIEDPKAATLKLLDQAKHLLKPGISAWAYLVSDFQADATIIEKVLEAQTDIPIVGGFAADDNEMNECILYANRLTLSNAMVLLVAEGQLDFEIRIGNTLHPVGSPGIIDIASGAEIDQIDGIPARDFVERESGKPLTQLDSGITSLSIIDSDQKEIKRLRSIVTRFSREERTLTLYGGIETGRTVQVCLARPEELIAEVHSIARGFKQEGFDPAAALIVSCTGRKSILDQDAQQEVNALTEQFGDSLPIAGFPSFGEIGPLKTSTGYSRNLFHNMTYVLTLFRC